MKNAIMLLALTVSLNSFGAEVSRLSGATSALPIVSTLMTSTDESLKAAQNVIDDSQEYFQSGKLTLRLSVQVNQLLESNSDLSVDEAVDALVNQAATILE